MKKKLPFIIGLLAVIVFCIWFGNTDKAHRIYDNNVNTAQYASLGVIGDQQSISQTFLCEENTLDAFMIKCSPTGNYGGAEITLTIRDAETGKVLATGSDSGSNVQPRKLHRFNIDRITGYKGKPLTIEFAETGSSAGNGIELYYQPEAETIGDFIVNGEAFPGVMVMKTITERFDVETFAIALFSILFIWGFLYFLYKLFQ